MLAELIYIDSGKHDKENVAQKGEIKQEKDEEGSLKNIGIHRQRRKLWCWEKRNIEKRPNKTATKFKSDLIKCVRENVRIVCSCNKSINAMPYYNYEFKRNIFR